MASRRLGGGPFGRDGPFEGPASGAPEMLRSMFGVGSEPMWCGSEPRAWQGGATLPFDRPSRDRSQLELVLDQRPKFVKPRMLSAN